ncbi:hypothetical protein ACSSS7_005382 [Eimeria intestinalis]
MTITYHRCSQISAVETSEDLHQELAKAEEGRTADIGFESYMFARIIKFRGNGNPLEAYTRRLPPPRSALESTAKKAFPRRSKVEILEGVRVYFLATASAMFCPAATSPRPADNEVDCSHASPGCDISTSSSNVCDESGGNEASSGASSSSNRTGSGEGAGRTVVEKIHLLPVSEEAPKSWVFATLTGLMKDSTIVRQYMSVVVKRPAKELKSSRRSSSENAGDSTPKNPDAEYRYIVVACLPHSGIITSATVVFTSGSPLKALRRVQLLALVHPNSACARRAGVVSYSEALQRGLVGGVSAPSRSSSSSSSRQEQGAGQHDQGSSTNLLDESVGAEASPAVIAAASRRHLGSPFDWGEGQFHGQQGHHRDQRRRRRLVREYNRAEDVIAAVLEDSAPESDAEGSEDDADSMGGGTAFRMSDLAQPQKREADSKSPTGGPTLPGRTLQRNFNFSFSTGDQVSSSGDASAERDDPTSASVRHFSERVLFYDFVAPYFRGRCADASSSASTGLVADGPTSRDSAVVVFPGKKLVIKDLTFVVWATDPENAPGFLRSDTVGLAPQHTRFFVASLSRNVSSQLMAYFGRVQLTFKRSAPVAAAVRILISGDGGTLQPYAFSILNRGVEFKVIATEPSSVPLARVGPETMVHFEGTLNPSLIDILPPEILTRVRRLPARVQPFAIIAAAQSLDPSLLLRVLPSGVMRGNQRGIDEGLEAAVEGQLVRPFCLSDYQSRYAHLCTRKPQDSPARENADQSGSEIQPAPPSRTAVSLPRSTLPECAEAAAAVAEAAAGGWELEAPCCTVCTLQLQDGTESLTLTCGHAFHWGCARAWLRCSATCPNCRAEVVLPAEGGRSVARPGENIGTAAFGVVRSALAEFFSN